MPPHFEVKNSVLPATSCIHLFQTFSDFFRLGYASSIDCHASTRLSSTNSPATRIHSPPLNAHSSAFGLVCSCFLLLANLGLQLTFKDMSTNSRLIAFYHCQILRLGLFQKLFDFFHNITKLSSTLLGLYFIYLIPISLTLTSQLNLCSFWQMYPMLSKASFI